MRQKNIGPRTGLDNRCKNSPLSEDHWPSRRGSHSRSMLREWECQSSRSPPTLHQRCYRPGCPCFRTHLQIECLCARYYTIRSCDAMFNSSVYARPSISLSLVVRPFPHCLSSKLGVTFWIWLIKFMPWRLNWQRASRVAVIMAK